MRNPWKQAGQKLWQHLPTQKSPTREKKNRDPPTNRSSTYWANIASHRGRISNKKRSESTKNCVKNYVFENIEPLPGVFENSTLISSGQCIRRGVNFIWQEPKIVQKIPQKKSEKNINDWIYGRILRAENNGKNRAMREGSVFKHDFSTETRQQCSPPYLLGKDCVKIYASFTFAALMYCINPGI